jgi:hypothetical protein
MIVMQEELGIDGNEKVFMTIVVTMTSHVNKD